MNGATRKIVAAGALAALDVVFTRLLAVNTPIMKIGIGFLAVAVCAALYGPLWGAACGALGDLAGSLLFPTGAYFPGFTLTAALSGLLFGLFLKGPFTEKHFRLKAAAAALLNTLLVSFLANTLMISLLTGTAYGKLLAARAIQLTVMFPLQILLLTAVLPLILKRIK